MRVMEQQRVYPRGRSGAAGRKALIHLTEAILVAVQTLLFCGLWWIVYSSLGTTNHPFAVLESWGITLGYLLLYRLFAGIYGGFQVGNASAPEIIYSLALAQFFTLFFVYFLACLVVWQVLNPLFFLGLWAVGCVTAALWTLLDTRLYQRLFPPKKSCIIYGHVEAYQEVLPLKKMCKRFRIEGEWPVSIGMDALCRHLADMEAVFLCGLHASDRNKLLKFCIENHIEVYARPKIGDLLLGGAEKTHLQNMPFLHCSRNHTSLLYQVVKRGMDICMSGLTLLVLSPVMAVVALAIKLHDGGPAFYRQTRLTKDGRAFDILKFRSMRVDAEKDGVARLASTSDDRITPIGHLIRKVRMDELPQLVNILKGDMSIVGPRPERPEIAAQYAEAMPEFNLRLQVKAGLTGYAQIYGKYNTRPYEKLQMDLLYIANQSILQDLKLIFVTVKILFMPESTEGISEGQITAAGPSWESTDHKRTI